MVIPKNKHIVFGQDIRFSFHYLYALIVFFIISSGSVFACHHQGQTSNTQPSHNSVSTFTTESYSEVVDSDTKHYSLEKKVPTSNSGHLENTENDLTQKTSHKASSNPHTHSKTDSEQTSSDLDCCTNNNAECSTTHLCECSYNAGKEGTSLHISPTKGVPGPIFTIITALSHKSYTVRPITWATPIPHPSYFSLFESWLL
jgi:hypothetical protein